MKNHIANASPIDAVITWVDGNDPNHRRKRHEMLANDGGYSEIPIAAGRDDTRFADNGELRYCLASIRKFAPWVRHIFLVTDNQVPHFLTPELTREYRVKIIDHREIFTAYEWALPTFNSRTIETAIWRIDELADRFIYFNDDFLLVKAINPDEFFPDGSILLRGEWQASKHYGKLRVSLNLLLNLLIKHLLGRTRTMNLAAQMRSAKLAGFSKKYFQSPHTPRPVRKNTLADYFSRHPQIFEENIKYKFRDMSQFLAISLADHLEIIRGEALLAGCDEAAIIRGEQDSAASIRGTLEQVERGEYNFLCLGSLEKLGGELRAEVYRQIDGILGLQTS